ncbi:MAG: hypothetical protein ACTHMK_13850 [Dyella sp.]|uniref:hypothetical protein n=1 Tax=Dyella sp. TaxID=1869338 RepID=UPI003F7DD189
MIRPVPHVGPTLGNRRALSHYTQLAEQARLERERADQIHAALEVDALIARARSAGQLVPQEVDEPAWRFAIKVAAALIVMAGVGVILRDPVARLLMSLGWLS